VFSCPVPANINNHPMLYLPIIAALLCLNQLMLGKMSLSLHCRKGNGRLKRVLDVFYLFFYDE